MTTNPNFIAATMNPLIPQHVRTYMTEPKYPPTCAVIIDPATNSRYDEAWCWETAQNYAMQGYIVQAVSGDAHLTQQECQALYDSERQRFIDCWGRTTPFDN